MPNDGGGLFSTWLGYFSGRRHDTTRPTAASTCGGGENTQKIDMMMQMMIRMEQRCCRLEAECSSLKSMMETKMEQDDSKFDSLVRHHLFNNTKAIDEIIVRQFEYNNMLVKNQSWEYSVPVHSAEYWENSGYGEDVAEYLADGSECLKECSIALRRGEFPEIYYDTRKGIDLCWQEDDLILDLATSNIMYSHWVEFANALTQFTPAFGVLPDGCETYFTLENIQLGVFVPGLLKDALKNKPFQKLCFVNKAGAGDNEGMSVDAILEIMNCNEHLRKLTIGNNRIGMENMEKICSFVRFGSIVDLDLRNCFENGLGDEIMTCLLIRGGLAKLKSLGLASNGITSSSITLLSDFLATSPMLKELNLEGNILIDNDAEVLSNALRSNTTLRYLKLSDDAISDAGKEAFRLVLNDDSSLNSVANSNHSCVVHIAGLLHLNYYAGEMEPPNRYTRAQKIFELLSVRNRSMSNVKHFDDIDVKLLPGVLGAVLWYASYARIVTNPLRVPPLSIVYEVMRKWDKVFPLYAVGGNKDKGNVGIE